MSTLIESPHPGFQDTLRSVCEVYLQGKCGFFAIALHRGLGWPIIILRNEGELVHVGVETPEGNPFDVRGEVSWAEFGKPFGMKGPYALQRNATEQQATDGEAGEKAEIEIDSALRKAQSLWPFLPWGPHTPLKRQLEFMKELEMLSDKYGFSIRGAYPNHDPVIEDRDEGETYEVFHIGLSMSFRRKFKDRSL